MCAWAETEGMGWCGELDRRFRIPASPSSRRLHTAGLGARSRTQERVTGREKMHIPGPAESKFRLLCLCSALLRFLVRSTAPVGTV